MESLEHLIFADEIDTHAADADVNVAKLAKFLVFLFMLYENRGVARVISMCTHTANAVL